MLQDRAVCVQGQHTSSGRFTSVVVNKCFSSQLSSVGSRLRLRPSSLKDHNVLTASIASGFGTDSLWDEPPNSLRPRTIPHLAVVNPAVLATDSPAPSITKNNLSRLLHTSRGAATGTFELTLRHPRDSMERPLVLRPRDKDSLELEVAAPLITRIARDSSLPGPAGGSRPSEDGQRTDAAPPGTSWKYLVALCAVSVVICYADRSNMSTAILPMAELFNWDKAFQGLVLSAFFSGYALTQVLGGQLADKLGGKVVLASGVALWSLFTFATPEAAAMGTVPLIAARVLLGVGEGVAFPSIHSLIARNVPQASQSTAVGIVTTASYIGTALAFGVSPMIISHFGWQWVFFLFSGLALLWLPLWLPVKTSETDGWQWMKRPVSNSPGALAASVTEERALLLPAAAGDGRLAVAGGAVPGAPRGFWALMRRREVWAICVAQYCQSWGMYGLLTWLPTFFSDFYHIDIADLAAYTLAPYLVQGALGLLAGVVADRLMARGWSVKSVRTILQVTGMLGPAVCLMLAVSPAVGATPALASQLITVGLGFSALTLGGVSASHLDVAPRHAGVIFGAGNTAGTLAGLLSVPCTGYLLQATNSWPLVFGVTAGHYVLGAIVWAAWVGDRQLPEDLEEPPPASHTAVPVPPV